MPRIEADSIEEHVRLQTARILDAASRLFRERGYRGTDMEDIARAIGLARNSLYRYYPSKDHILLDCVQRDMEPYLGQLRALEASMANPRERIAAWVNLQVEMATSPAHHTLEQVSEIRQEAPELRRRLLELHDAPAAVLETALDEILRSRRRDTATVAAMIAGMVQAAAARALGGGNAATVKRELRRAVERILEA